MKLFAIIFVTACLLVTIIDAAPEKTRIGQKSRAKNQDALVDVVAKQDQDVKVGNSQSVGAAGAGAGVKDPSSGRLFLKKFLTFKNLFSSNNQPVIPIIITGAGTGTTTGTASPTSPTVTVTSTGTIPTATGTITTSPTSPTSPTTASSRQQQSYGNDDDNQDADQEQQEQAVQQPAAAYPSDLMDEQALQAALAAGAQEYEVVTGEEVQGTGPVNGAGESKATSSHINLRRKGARRGQVISVRIPPRYRRYFKNGQKVMLNTGSRPGGNKRRVVRKRVPAKKLNNRRRGGNKKNRKNRNKNRRTRIIPA
ncbi:uncharacterized protein [Drosophila bipectinata]|uniref:uncharacterized protein n=1 Tax=Drosophila bipectinata TaxID=42026 RepID=UPI001C8A8458|nr:uncharacterized protein LOC108120187 [Drosophila bipectinata]